VNTEYALLVFVYDTWNIMIFRRLLHFLKFISAYFMNCEHFVAFILFACSVYISQSFHSSVCVYCMLWTFDF